MSYRRVLTVTTVFVLAGAAPASVAVMRAPAAPPPPHLAHTHCDVFPANNIWNTSIRTLPVNSHSAEWMKHIGRGLDLHPDFGPSFGAQPVPYGIPITVVGAHHKRAKVHFTYSSESDHVRYPLGADTRIEGGRHADGDRHAIIVDRSTCRVYETFDTRHTSHGWHAGSGATWSLRHNHLRLNGWTSADAAGLPILPGLLRWSEVKAGHVNHAIRFTAPTTSRHFLWPARHEAGSTSSPAYPPMGARFRLKASFPIAHYSQPTRAVLRAMKTYGLILADNGSPWFFQGASSTHWPNRLLDELKTIPASAFQAVDESSLQRSPNSARAQ